MTNYPINFVESNVLLAMGEGNTETAEEILAGMTDSQIRYLLRSTRETMRLCGRILYERERGERPPWAQT